MDSKKESNQIKPNQIGYLFFQIRMKSGTFCVGFWRWVYDWFVPILASTWPTATAKACPAFWTSTNPFWTIWGFHSQTLKSWNVRTRDLRVSWLPFLKSGFSTSSKWYRYNLTYSNYKSNNANNSNSSNIHNNNISLMNLFQSWQFGFSCGKVNNNTTTSCRFAFNDDHPTVIAVVVVVVAVVALYLLKLSRRDSSS